MGQEMASGTPVVVAPETDALWHEYLECRFRNLYIPYGLPRSVNTSELDEPRVRPDVRHGAVVLPERPDRIVACARLDLQPSAEGGPRAQIRYFSTETECRGRGIGRMLMRTMEAHALAAGCPYVWMEARLEAVEFYLRIGYADLGPGPTKYEVLHHRIMARRVDAP